jgi:hypothetical protein
MRGMMQTAVLFTFLFSPLSPSVGQTNPNLQTYFKDYIGLNDEQIAAIRGGQAFAKNLHSRMADEIFVFGAVYINATPESYLPFAQDFNRLRSLPGFLAIGEFSDPPQLSDLKALTLDSEDVKELKDCNPGDCKI